MMKYFAQLCRDGRYQAADYAVMRLSMLMLMEDLSSVSEPQFKLLCQLLNGIAVSPGVDAKSDLLSAVHGALSWQGAFRDDISGRVFAGDTRQSRSTFVRELDQERRHLRELADVIDSLNYGACVALLIRVEEVYAGTEPNVDDRCHAIYEKMQARRQL